MLAALAAHHADGRNVELVEQPDITQSDGRHWATLRTVDDYGPAPKDQPAAYPGQWPEGPVMVVDDRVIPVTGDHATHDRLPIVAVGSNGCPAQLRRKGMTGSILMTPAVLRNHLVVYAGHVTTYGSVPATVVRWGGASCDVMVLWLTFAQAKFLHRSEPNYDRVVLPTSHGAIPGYRAKTGILLASGDPVRLRSIRADAPHLPPAMTQGEAMAFRELLSA